MFHENRGELHGITVAVDATTEAGGPEVWVGRCDIADDRAVVLRDADVLRTEGAAPDADGEARRDFLTRAVAVGVWPRHRHVVLPRGRVLSIRRLVEVDAAPDVKPKPH